MSNVKTLDYVLKIINYLDEVNENGYEVSKELQI